MAAAATARGIPSQHPAAGAAASQPPPLRSGTPAAGSSLLLQQPHGRCLAVAATPQRHLRSGTSAGAAAYSCNSPLRNV